MKASTLLSQCYPHIISMLFFMFFIIAHHGHFYFVFFVVVFICYLRLRIFCCPLLVVLLSHLFFKNVLSFFPLSLLFNYFTVSLINNLLNLFFFFPSQWHPLLLTLHEAVKQVSGYSFNSLLCNLYRDGHDSIGWHSDDEASLGAKPTIASLSLGDTRVFSLRKQPPPVRWCESMKISSLCPILTLGLNTAQQICCLHTKVKYIMPLKTECLGIIFLCCFYTLYLQNLCLPCQFREFCFIIFSEF